MMQLNRIFEQYTGLLRSLKWVYWANNVLNARYLQRNKPLYRRYGLHKSVLSSIGARDFNGQHHPDIPWLDRPDALDALEQHPDFKQFDPALQNRLRQFVQQGFLVLEGFFTQDQTDALNEVVAQLLAKGDAGFNYTGRKIVNLFEKSATADEQFFRNPDILRLLSFLLGKPAVPFQSLNFMTGSEQRAHSDFIHMSTEPQGYLIATWIALEDCHEFNGPLFYYPGSHRLPYLTTEHYDSGNTSLTIGANSNRQYEDKIASLIEEKGLEKQLFLAKRGDVLIWHANLLHGGTPILTAGSTRKSMVCHYFAEDVICYHEMTQRPAIIKVK